MNFKINEKLVQKYYRSGRPSSSVLIFLTVNCKNSYKKILNYNKKLTFYGTTSKFHSEILEMKSSGYVATVLERLHPRSLPLSSQRSVLGLQALILLRKKNACMKTVKAKFSERKI